MKKLILLSIILLPGISTIKTQAIGAGRDDKFTTKPVENEEMTASLKPIKDADKNGVIQMVYVQGGSFDMGGNDVGDDAKPVHRVTLRGFFIGKYEVTQAQWKAVMGSNPSAFHGCDNCPVESVSWDDVQDFIKKLNKKTGKHYRLPTEAEWEFAARGGVKGKGYIYGGGNDLSAVAWNAVNASSKTQAKGQKKSQRTWHL